MPIDFTNNNLLVTVAVELRIDNPITFQQDVHRWSSAPLINHDPILSERSITLSPQTNDLLGGLAPLSLSGTVHVVNLSYISEIMRDSTLLGSQLTISLVDAAGEERLLFSGVVVSREFSNDEWVIIAEHSILRSMTSFPKTLLSPLNTLDDRIFGQPVPYVFGSMEKSPYDGSGRDYLLAPAISLDGASRGRFRASHNLAVSGDLYELFQDSVLEIPNQTNETIEDSVRRIRLYLGSDADGNGLRNWRDISDGENTTYANIEADTSSTRMLGRFTSLSDAGDITAARLVLRRFDNTTSFDAGWGVTLGTLLDSNIQPDVSDPNLYIHPLVADVSWNDLSSSLLTLPSINIDIADCYIEVTFTKREARELPTILQKARGPNITNSTNFIRQVEFILTDSDFYGFASTLLDSNTFDVAAAAIDGWQSAFAISTIQERDLLDALLKECGAFLYIREGLIAVGLLGRATAPVTAFIDPYHILEEAGGVSCDFYPESRITNDISVRWGSGPYRDIIIASSLSRSPQQTAILSGGVWTVQGHNAQVGDDCYDATTGRLHEITATTANSLTVDPAPTGNGRIFYGSNLNVKSIRSRFITNTVRSMGGSVPNFSDLGSYDSVFIANEATAKLWIDFMLDRLSIPLLLVKFITYHKAESLHIGDTVLFDSPLLPGRTRTAAITTLLGVLTEYERDDRLAFRTMTPVEVGDYLVLGQEVMRVIGVTRGRVQVERGVLDSSTQAHNDRATVRVFTRPFQVKTIIKNINNLTWTITLEELPRSKAVPQAFGEASGSVDLTLQEHLLRESVYVSNVNGLLVEGAPDVNLAVPSPGLTPLHEPLLKEGF